MRLSPNNTTSSPPWRGTAGGDFLPLLSAALLTSARTNPVWLPTRFSPHHSNSYARAHLSELPTSMRLNRVSRKWLSRWEQLTWGVGVGGGGGGAEKVHACAKLRHSRLTRMRRSLFVSSNLTQPTLSPSVMLHFEKFKPNNLIEWAEVLCYSPTTKPRTHVYTHTHTLT